MSLDFLPPAVALILEVIFLVGGFWVLIKGADIFVEGASSVAGNLKVPKILIGLTIVAFGTSAPEFAVSVKSMLSHSGDIVLGNVIGSNILNILLILGCSSLFHSLKVKHNTSKNELPMLTLLTTLLAVLLADHLFDAGASDMLTRSDGIVVVLFFAIFLYYLFGLAKTQKEDIKGEEYLSMGKAWGYTLLGIVAIIAGSELVVGGASAIAEFFHVSEKMIALTIVALGTSLPELVTSITATRKGEYDLALGNVIGSNIFNIGVVLGIPIAIFGGISTAGLSSLDIIVMLLAAVLLWLFGANDRQITRREGVVFLVLFVIYYSYVIISGIA